MQWGGEGGVSKAHVRPDPHLGALDFGSQKLLIVFEAYRGYKAANLELMLSCIVKGFLGTAPPGPHARPSSGIDLASK